MVAMDGAEALEGMLQLLISIIQVLTQGSPQCGNAAHRPDLQARGSIRHSDY